MSTVNQMKKYDLISNSLINTSIEHLEVVELEDNPLESQRKTSNAMYHSVLAMEAARKMRRTRQKLKTGQMVCHHLRMMLTSEPVQSNRDTINQNEPQFQLGF